MAIFMPTWVTPDLRSGLGLGVVDATQDMTVSWRITGPSALTAFSITIYDNDSASTQKYTTGQLTTGCPAYGTSSAGEPQMFSYTIPAAALSSAGITNGNEYKLIIKQWWSADDSVTQASASAFITRAAPSLAVDAIGTGGVIGSRSYTFTGSYSQAQGDTLNWFRWQIASADDTDTLFFDSGKISGTMDISCTFDGFFTEEDYAVRLTAQTENGVDMDTGWVSFSVSYGQTAVTGGVEAGCVGGTDAVLVKWSGIGYVPGNAVGSYDINDGILTLYADGTISWDSAAGVAMNFANPWSIVWKGQPVGSNAALFTIGQSGGNIVLGYDRSSNTVTLKRGNTTLVSQSGIANAPTITALLTPTSFYLRVEAASGGLMPSGTLYPSETLYPSSDTQITATTYTLSPSYTQTAITSVSVGGYQVCDYIEVLEGIASGDTVTAAITNGTYVPGLGDSEYMLADWTDGIDAGTLNIGGDTIVGYSLYRRQGDSAALVKIADTDAETVQVYDYSALSQQGPYTYYLFLKGATTFISTPIVSGTVMPCWWNWTLMECEETEEKNAYTVIKAYRFKHNIETGAVSNNNAPNLLENFTPYPKVQLAPQNYKSSSLTGLIGAIDWSSGQPEYIDTPELSDALYALSVTQNPLFLKNRKGELFRIRIAGAITMQTMDATFEQAQVMTLPWVETGSTANVNLYSVSFAGVQDKEGAFVPQYYMDTSDATADAATLRIQKTAYGAEGLIVGDAFVEVDGNTLSMPEGMEE